VPYVLLAVVAIALLVGRRALRSDPPARAEIDPSGERTTIDPDSGAVTSIQAADLTMPRAQLEAIWTPMHLERLARTYWRFLTRATLGLVRIRYTETERFICVIGRPLVLFQFAAPEYEMDAVRGIVRWRIVKGLLVSRRGKGGTGYLEIDALRRPSDRDGYERLHVEVEIANYYPEIESRLGRWVYANTQSRAHVMVTHGFLRSLARLDLAESVVGRYATVDDVPDPVAQPREPVAS
jgi:hypothetical protein